MLEIYKKRGKKLVKTRDYAKGTWVNVVTPIKEEVDFLHKKFGIPKDIINDPMDTYELPRIQKEKKFTFIVIRVPYKNEVNATTIPLAILLTKDSIITISKKPILFLEELTEKPKRRTRFLLKLFDRCNKTYSSNLHDINKLITRKEVNLKSLKNEDVLELFDTEKTLNTFNTSLMLTIGIFEKLLKGNVIKWSKYEIDIIEDIIIDSKQDLETSKTLSKTVVNIRNAYSSIISNDLNKIMKFLAAITVVLTIPTIIASIYGMNINLPIQHSAAAFTYIIVITSIICFGIVIMFVRRKWF